MPGGRVSVALSTGLIVVKGNRARAIETFGTVAEPADPASDPPINLQGQVSVSFEKADGRWQIVEWGRVL